MKIEIVRTFGQTKSECNHKHNTIKYVHIPTRYYVQYTWVYRFNTCTYVGRGISYNVAVQSVIQCSSLADTQHRTSKIVDSRYISHTPMLDVDCRRGAAD